MSPVDTAEVLKIVEEDILRITGEKNSKISLEALKSNIKVSDGYFNKAIKKLKKENLIRLKPGFLELTKEGQEKAENIIKKHMVIENYFKKTRDEKEAHRAAHIIEHYISKEAIRNIKKLSTLRKESTPLTGCRIGQEIMISDIVLPDSGLFERMVSLGIFPGEKIKIMYRIPDGFVVSVNRKKIALGKDIAKNIEVLE